MTNKVITAKVSEGVRTAGVIQAPAWDYENAKRIEFTPTSGQTALSAGLWLFTPFTTGCHYTIGAASGDPIASSAAAGSMPLAVGDRWAETVVGEDQEIAVVSSDGSTTGHLYAIPAKTEG